MNKLKIKKNVYFLYLTFFLCFEPKLAVKFSFFNKFYIIGIIIIFLIISAKYFLRGKISKLFLMLIIFRLSFFIQTISNSNGDIMMWGYTSIVLITLCMTFECYLKKLKIIFLNILINTLLIMLTINLIISYIYPNGVVDGIFFIGIRTRISDVIFPMLAFSLISDNLSKKKLSFRTFLCIIVGFLSIVRFYVVTAIVGIFLFSFGYLCLFRCKKIHKYLNLRMIVYIGVIISILFTFFNIHIYFKKIVVTYLNKEATLSSRTLIWKEAIKYIKISPIFGSGLVENGNFIYWGYRGGVKGLWQAHNNWLQLLYDGGIVSMMIFLKLLNINTKKLVCCENKYVVSILTLVIAVILIMMIAEIFIYTPYFYLLIFMMANLNDLLI